MMMHPLVKNYKSQFLTLELERIRSQSIHQGTSYFLPTRPSEFPPTPITDVGEITDTSDFLQPSSSVGHRFALARGGFDLTQGGKQAAIISTCVSMSAESFAVVTEREFMVHTWSHCLRKPVLRCVGRFELDGNFKSGPIWKRLRPQGRLLTEKRRARPFMSAAMNDDYLAITVAGTNKVLIFAIGDNDSWVGRCVFMLHQPGLVKLVLFSSTEIAMLSEVVDTKCVEEVWQFYSLESLPSSQDRRRHGLPMPVQPSCHLRYKATAPVPIAGSPFECPYDSIDARFSSDGHRVVTYSRHISGSMMVTILARRQDREWEMRGRRPIVLHGLHPWDKSCLGATGVSLYLPQLPTGFSCFMLTVSHRPDDTLDEALLFSLDFPSEPPQDCYKIRTSVDGGFLLKGKRSRIPWSANTQDIAIAVSQHGIHDVIVVLSIDG